MRVHAYLVRSERFLKVEDRVLERLSRASREELLELLGKGYVKLELMSGEWRSLFEKVGVYDPIINGRLRMARMVVAPDRLAKLVNVLWHHEINDLWLPHGIEGESSIRDCFEHRGLTAQVVPPGEGAVGELCFKLRNGAARR